LKGTAAAASRRDIYGRLREANPGRIQDQLLPSWFQFINQHLFCSGSDSIHQFFRKFCPKRAERSIERAIFFTLFFQTIFKYDTDFFFSKLTLLAAPIRMARQNHVATLCMGRGRSDDVATTRAVER